MHAADQCRGSAAHPRLRSRLGAAAELPVNGLGFQLNYTDVSQHPEGGTGQPAVAVGISPTTYNGTVYYDNGPASIRAVYTSTTTSRLPRAPNQEGLTGNRFWTDEYDQLDLSASWKFEGIASEPQITLNVINITGETQRQTWGNDSIQFENAARTFYDPGFAVLLGVRGTF